MKRLETYLKKLGLMRKKDVTPSFESMLRNKLIKEANLMKKTAPVQKASIFSGMGERFSRLFSWKTMTPAVAMATLLIVLVTVINPGLQGLQLVDVASAQEYYTLTPLDGDLTGIGEDSSFLLESKGDLKLKEVKKALNVSPDVELSFEQNGDNILISANQVLETGEIYEFTLDADQLKNSPYDTEYSWAFEVSDSLRVTGTLPGDLRSGIDRNTGIEIQLTHYGVTQENFEEHFEISPAVSGNFTVNERTATFAPSSPYLDEGTIYTVKVKAGLGVADTENILADDYTFQFETGSSYRSSTIITFPLGARSTSLSYSPDEIPSARITLYSGNDSVDDSVDLSLFRYENGDDYIEAQLDHGNRAPQWAYIARRNSKVETDTLTRSYHYPDLSLRLENGVKWVDLDEYLAPGYYVMQAEKNDALAQVFVQVTPLASYVNISDESGVVWVNSTDTGTAVENAEVEVIATKMSVQTDGNGIAQLGDLTEQGIDPSTYFGIKISNGEDTAYVKARTTSDGFVAQNVAWELLRTDRPVYKPNDTLNYWGFIEGKEGLIEGEASVVLSKGGQPFFLNSNYFAGADISNVFYEEEIILENGKAYSGEIELKELPTSYFTLNLIQDGKILSTDNFYVENYDKPEYSISLTSNGDDFFVGDTVSLDLNASFFEGTPVSYTEFEYTLPDGSTGRVETNEFGEAEFSFTTELSACDYNSTYCANTNYQNIVVKPVSQQLADISESKRIYVYRTLVDHTKADADFDSIEIDLKTVVLNSERDDWPAATDARVEIDVFRQDKIEVEGKEIYDPITKSSTYETKTETIDVFIETLELRPDEDGQIVYNLGLVKGNNYTLEVKTFDKNNSEYRWKRGVYSYSSNLDYLQIDMDKESYSLNDKVKLNATSSDPENILDAETGDYLFIMNVKGELDVELEDGPEHSFKFQSDMVPNITLDAVLFDGKSYIASYDTSSVRFDYEQQEMGLSIKTDKKEYGPGETVKVDLSADSASQVNLSLVDEAFYDLFGSLNEDPLRDIYESTYYGSNREISHLINDEGFGGKGGCFVPGTQITLSDGQTIAIEDIKVGDVVRTRVSVFDGNFVSAKVRAVTKKEVGEYFLVNGELGVTDEHVLYVNGKWKLAADLELGDDLLADDGKSVIVETIKTIREKVWVYNFEVEKYHTYFADGIYVHNDKGGEVRSEFEDTAVFLSFETDANGNAHVEFELPDNITNWKATAYAIAPGDMPLVGFETIDVPVSREVFALPVLNTQYLEGDKPQVPIAAFGTALELGDDVEHEMSLRLKGEDETIFEEGQIVKAFESSLFALPALQQGIYTVRSYVGTAKHDDAIDLDIEVLESHLTEANAFEALLKDGMSIEGAQDGRTQIVFTNNDYGVISRLLYGGMYQRGDRLDQQLQQQLGSLWLNEYLGEEKTADQFTPNLYQDSDGGLALLPYADPDLRFTALAANLEPELFNEVTMGNYMRGILLDSNRTEHEKVLAIYGMSGLGEKALVELDYFEANFDQSNEDKLYTALAYINFGAEDKAGALYLELLSAKGMNQQEMTLLAALAEALSSDQVDELWKVALKAQNKLKNPYELTLMEQLLFAKYRLEREGGESVSFRLNGERIALDSRSRHKVSLLPEELTALEIEDVDGGVHVLSHYQSPVDLDSFESTAGVNITRTYIVDGKEVDHFNAGDLVEVHVKVSVPRQFERRIRVTDVLPSNLKVMSPIYSTRNFNYKSGYRRPYFSADQSNSFFLYCKSGDCHNKFGDFYYVARVINGGEFITEPVLVEVYEDASLKALSGDRGTVGSSL